MHPSVMTFRQPDHNQADDQAQNSMGQQKGKTGQTIQECPDLAGRHAQVKQGQYGKPDQVHVLGFDDQHQKGQKGHREKAEADQTQPHQDQRIPGWNEKAGVQDQQTADNEAKKRIDPQD